MWELRYHEDAVAEWQALPPPERRALRTVLRYLAEFGDQLGSPHSSAVKSSTAKLRELRPRAGRSPWRALYRRLGDAMVILAVVPDAKANERAFDQGVRRAEERLREWPTGAADDEQALPDG